MPATLDLDAVFARNRALFGDSRMEGEDPGAGDPPAGGEGKTYVPPSTQEELDRIIQNRVQRATSKFSDYDSLKEKAGRQEALELELGSAADKAAALARAEERANATAEFTPRVVRAEFKAAAKGVLTNDQVSALLEDLDLSKYINDQGEVDEEKIAKRVAAFAPASSNGTTSHQTRTLGQGNHQQSTPAAGDAGRAYVARKSAAAQK